MGVFDSIIEKVSPRWALARSMYRAQLEHERAYDAASLSRLRTPLQKAMGPHAESRASRAQILRSVRDLDRNNSFAHGAINSIVNNVVGNGIEFESKASNDRGEPLKELNRERERLFREWADAVDFYGKQRLVERECWIAGEVLVVSVVDQRGDLPIPLDLEIVEAERLIGDDRVEKNGNKTIQGIEFDKSDGRIVAYHIYKANPFDSSLSVGDDTNSTQRITSDRVLHVFEPVRPGHVRGVSKMASVVTTFEALKEALNFELTRIRIASAFAVLHKRGGSFATTPGVGTTAPSQDDLGNDLSEITGGMIIRGGPTDSLESVGARIEPAFEAFVTLMLRSIAVGLNISYELLARDFTKTNFSSARSASLEDRRHWEPRQRQLTNKLNRPVFRWFDEIARLSGVAAFSTNEASLWRAPGWSWIDPLKEVNADRQAIMSGMVSPQEVARRRGHDFGQTIEDIAEAKRYSEELGVTLDVFGPDQTAETTFETEDDAISISEAS